MRERREIEADQRALRERFRVHNRRFASGGRRPPGWHELADALLEQHEKLRAELDADRTFRGGIDAAGQEGGEAV